MNRFESHLTIGLVLVCCSQTAQSMMFKTIFGIGAALFIFRAMVDSLTDED